MFGGDLPPFKHLHQAPARRVTALLNFNVSHSRSRFKTDRVKLLGFFFQINFVSLFFLDLSARNNKRGTFCTCSSQKPLKAVYFGLNLFRKIYSLAPELFS